MIKYVLIIFVWWVIMQTVAVAQEPAPTPELMPGPARLAAPAMPTEPTQADYGAQVYWQVCMSCHGDMGQGLTAEFRALWGEEEQNCWQSKCHASNHPDEGFKLPKAVPAVIGKGRLNHYQTSEQLYGFISTRMPWQAPGSLSATEYEQLTAYLLRANNHPQAGEIAEPVAKQQQALIGLIIASALFLPLLIVSNLLPTRER